MSETEDTKPAAPQPRHRSRLRRILAGAGILLGMLVLLIVGAVLALDSGPGRRWAEGLANDLAGDAIAIEGIQRLALLDRIEIDRLRVKDAGGAWLTVDKAVLDWRPSALLHRRLEVGLLSAETVAIDRAPLPGPEEPPAEGGGVSLPLPVGLFVDRLEIGRIELTEALAGMAATLTAEGSLRLPRDARDTAIYLVIERLDAPATAKLAATYDAATDRITVDLDAAEPAGGVLVNLLQVPDRPAFRLQAKGEGPLDGFSTRLAAEAGPGLTLDATIAVAGATDRRITLDATANPIALLPPDIAPLLAEGLRLEAEALAPADGAIRIDRLVAGNGSARLTASGTIDPQSLALDIAAELETPLAPYSELAGQELAGDARLAATAQGTPQDLALTLKADATGLQLGGSALPVLGDNARMNAVARLGEAGSVAIDSFELAAGPLSASGSGRYAADAVELALTAALDDLARLAEVGIAGLAGRLDLQAGIDQTGGTAYDATLAARMTGLETGAPAARALLGDAPTLDAAGAIDTAAGTAQLDRLALKAPGLSLDGSGAAWDNFQAVNAKLSAAIPRLRELGQVVGTPMAGALTAMLAVDGTLEALTADAKLDWRNAMIAGQTLGAVNAALALDAVQASDPQGAASKGRLKLSASPQGQRTTLESDLAYGKNRLNLDNLRLNGLGMAARGGVAVDLSTSLVAGKLTGQIGDLAKLAAFAGQQAAGEVSFALEMAGKGGKQHAGGVVTGKGLRFQDNTVTVDALRLEAQLADVTGKPSGPVALKATGIEAGGQQLDSAAIDAELKGDIITVTADLKGEDIGATAAAAIQQGRRDTTITLNRLQANWQELIVRLNRPAVATLGPNRQALEGLDLAIDEGRLAGGAALTRSEVTADFALTDLPLSLVRKLRMAPRLAGTAGATLTLSGRPDNPSGRLTMALSRVAMAGPMAPDVPPADLTAEARLSDGRLTVQADLARMQGAQFKAQATLPAQVNLTAGQFALPPNGALQGKLTVAADLARLAFVALALGEDRIEGQLAGEIDIAGTIGNPVLSGQATMRDGSYLNDATGASLRNLTLDIAGEGRSLVLRNLSATDGDSGRLQGAGRVSFAGGGVPQVDMKISLQRLRIVNREEGRAYGSGELTLRNEGEGLIFIGRTRVDEADIRIPDTLPPSVTSLDVREVNIEDRTNLGERAKQRQIARQQQARNGAPPEPGLMDGLKLDLITDIPGQVFVRGRGLDAEFRGNVVVTGTAAQPVIKGDISVVRGGFSFAGRRFNLDRGTINLIPGERGGLEIGLDILAVAPVADIEAQIGIAGEVLQPRITLSSSPSLPQDEILSRILFGTNTGSLNGAQAARLAQSALELTGKLGTGGVIDDLRRSFGLDSLEVDAGDGTSGAGLRAGRYLTDKLYLGVNQGFGADSSAVVVEYRILKNVTIESRLGAQSAGDIGIVYEKRY
ncbi:translocation/assembly module TamB domain-containing protein [Oceanibaculum pacificum]|uniref:Translocation and assembly module TamB C-terminal domain-containing protein n=1 Tax=Oceanibaculum pacificum TaxID=580166 RepID=A0A154VUM8_9PROT|nr:translocation/assembly module TamB domain-containing protein [Oceanibaculum pacificum]KZD04908.1 hypothetical protein AUP43_11935 [Oceanibaculum pacificum]